MAEKNRQSTLSVLFAPKATQTRYMPTYRLESHNPVNVEKCAKIVKAVVENTLKDFTFTPKRAHDLCQYITTEINLRMKQQNHDRYKYICIANIGEKLYQGIHYSTSFLWDGSKDSYVKYVVDTPDYFATVIFYWIYYD